MWKTPNGHMRNQINHIAISKQFRRSLLDVRVFRSADIGSDHEMLVAKVQMKLNKVNIGSMFRRKYEYDKLKTPKITQSFQIHRAQEVRRIRPTHLAAMKHGSVDKGLIELPTYLGREVAQCEDS